MLAARVEFQRNVVALLLVMLLALGASGCTTVRLVSDYDEQLDQGLTSLYADTSAFVDRMIATRDRPEGQFQANIGFYSESTGRLDAMLARAQANQISNSCPSTRLTARLLDLAGVPADVRGQLQSLPAGSCQVEVLRRLRTAFNDGLRRYHEVRGTIPPEARGPILEGGLGSLFRTAILIEAAKRTGEN